MMVRTHFCTNKKDKTKQQKIVGIFLKNLTKMKDVLNSNKGAMSTVPVRMDGTRVLHMSWMILGKTNCTRYRYINHTYALGILTYFS